MYSPELLRVEAAECRRGAIGKSARVERTLLSLAERLEAQATVLEARSWLSCQGAKKYRTTALSPSRSSNIGKTQLAAIATMASSNKLLSAAASSA
jgi:hypothetical protein